MSVANEQSIFNDENYYGMVDRFSDKEISDRLALVREENGHALSSKMPSVVVNNEADIDKRKRKIVEVDCLNAWTLVLTL